MEGDGGDGGVGDGGDGDGDGGWSKFLFPLSVY